MAPDRVQECFARDELARVCQQLQQHIERAGLQHHLKTGAAEAPISGVDDERVALNATRIQAHSQDIVLVRFLRVLINPSRNPDPNVAYRSLEYLLQETRTPDMAHTTAPDGCNTNFNESGDHHEVIDQTIIGRPCARRPGGWLQRTGERRL